VIHQVEIVAGSLLLAICFGLFGAAVVVDADWRLGQRRRRLRRARATEVDLTGVKPS
jgi:hypothetical protein